jgi:hypothetical protein
VANERLGWVTVPLFYDKINRMDILSHAYRLMHANKGAPNIFCMTYAAVKAAGLENWRAGIERTYEPIHTTPNRCDG